MYDQFDTRTVTYTRLNDTQKLYCTFVKLVIWDIICTADILFMSLQLTAKLFVVKQLFNGYTFFSIYCLFMWSQLVYVSFMHNVEHTFALCQFKYLHNGL